jgi:hypothetical protein
MRRHAAVALAVCWLSAWPAAAQPATRVTLSYSIYAAGLNVANVEIGVSLDSLSYRVELAHQTNGLVGFFLRGSSFTQVDGSWQRNRPLPRRFRSEGIWRGERRLSLVEYERGQPLVRILVPPNDAEREPVPPEWQADTIDSLSAVAGLVRQVQQTGRCDGKARVFDGRRASEITARSAGDEIIPISSRSSFAGRAVRCDFTGEQRAGFLRSDNPKDARRPLSGSAWLAETVPGTARLPVRLTFDTRWFGNATMYLTSAGPSQDGRIAER